MAGCNFAITPIGRNAKLVKGVEEKLVGNTLFKQIVGPLKYLCNSMPNLFYSVGVISIFMENPKQPYLISAKRITRDVQGTLEHEILFSKSMKQCNEDLIGNSSFQVHEVLNCTEFT